MRSPNRDLAEVSIGYLLVLATVWTPNPLQRVLFWISLLVIVAFCLEGRWRGDPLGFSIRGFLRSWWAVALAFVAAVLTVELAERLGTLHYFFGHSLYGTHAWGYLIWATLQQLILQTFILTRLLRLTGRTQAVLFSALLFSLAHVPNPILVLATLLWGIASCLLYLRYRSLFTVGLIHFIFGVTLAMSVPSDLQHNMRVGLGYYFYRSSRAHVAPPVALHNSARVQR